jgi:ElaB/YqjD/DUF883 family membrane-anchored ribosome-binding protein
MTQNIQNEALIQDIKDVVTNAEELLAATDSQTGDKISSIRAKLKLNLGVARKNLMEMESIVKEKAKATAESTDKYVHENPWKSIGIATGVGLVIGILLNRK